MGWFNTLLWLFKGKSPLTGAQESFSEMLTITQSMLEEADEALWQGGIDDERRANLYASDIRVNQLEREVRRQVLLHLAGEEEPHSLAYALSLMSLVKDVERLGDYAKNLLELVDMSPEPIVESDETAELRAIGAAALELVCAAASSERQRDTAAARAAYERGRGLCKRCDALVAAVAASDHQALAAVRLAVGARYYKRVAGHAMNVLSSVLMPLHKLDFFDEGYLEAAE